MLDAGFDEHLTVKPDAAHLLAVKLGAKPAEGPRILIDYRHVVVQTLQREGQTRTHPATTHDHDMHADPSRVGVAWGCQGDLPRAC